VFENNIGPLEGASEEVKTDFKRPSENRKLCLIADRLKLKPTNCKL